MDYREVTPDREFLLTLSHGAEWREEVATFAADRDVRAAVFFGTGAVQDAELRYDDQDDFAAETVRFEEPLTVAACMGSITTAPQEADGPETGDDGGADDPAPEPHVEAGVVLARRSGQAIAGTLDRATVFTGELSVRTFAEPVARTADPSTDRDTWEL